MIYVLRTDRLVKIGRTANIKARMICHVNDSAGRLGRITFVGWMQGGKQQERDLWHALWAYRAPGKKRLCHDWFERKPEVDSYISSLKLKSPELIGYEPDGNPVRAIIPERKVGEPKEIRLVKVRDKRVQVMVTKDVDDRLKEIAKREGRTMSGLLAVVLERLARKGSPK